MRAYGDPIAITPHLDRLAALGVRFDRTYCNQAACAPSRNHLFIGLRSNTTGLYTLGLTFRRALPDGVTVPQNIRTRGYHAEAMGKVHHIGHGHVTDASSWSSPHHKRIVIGSVDPASKPTGALTREEAYFSNYRGDPPVDQLPRGTEWEHPEVLDNAYADGRIATGSAHRLKAHAASRQ